MSVINKKSTFTKLSYTLGDNQVIAIFFTIGIVNSLLAILNPDIRLISGIFIIASVVLILLCLLTKTKRQGRWLTEIGLSYIKRLTSKQEVNNTFQVELKKEYIRTKNKYIFAYQLFPVDELSNDLSTRGINSYIFYNLVNTSRYHLQFKTYKNQFNNSSLEVLGLTFDDSSRFEEYKYFVYISFDKPEDYSFTKKQIESNFCLQYKQLIPEEILNNY